MKKLIFFVAMCLMALALNAQRIAVLEFNAGSNISRADVDGISAIFNTYFSPQGYTLVERTRIDRIIDEQGFQYGNLSQDQMVRIGQLLNVSRVVVGDINYAFKQYNVDVRVVNVETGTIAAKAGTTWSPGASYRQMMKALAEDLANKVAILPVETKPEPESVAPHYTTNAEKLGISMYEGRYVYNGQFVSRSKVRKMTIPDIYATQDFASQVRLKKSKALIWSGWGAAAVGAICYGIGFGVGSSEGFEPYRWAGYTYHSEIKTGIAFVTIGSAAFATSISLLSTGYVHRDNIVKDYLNAPVKQQPSAEFRLQASQNGLGFAIAF